MIYSFSILCTVLENSTLERATAQGGKTMADFKKILPKVEEYILVVSIPLETPISLIVRNQTIHEAENSFISKRDKESDYKKKVEFDRARALLKWAAYCNAKLLEMHNANRKLKFSFGFPSMEAMIEFYEYLLPCVYGSTME